MTLNDLIKTYWDGSAAKIRTYDNKYVIYINDDGIMSFPTGGNQIPNKVVFSGDWTIEYSKVYDQEELIKALSKIDPSINDLRRTEWNIFDQITAKKVIQAVARALNYKVIVERYK